MGRKKKSKQKTKQQPNLRRQPTTSLSSKKNSRHSRYVLVGLTLAVIGLAFILLISPEHIPVFWSNDKLGNTRINFPQLVPKPEGRRVVFEDFVGSEVCAECHQEEYQVWRKSTHGRAGGSPQERDVLGKFNRGALKFKDGKVTPRRERDGTYVFEVEQTGFARKKYEVKAVVGGGFMEGGGTQTYFAEFPDGTLRFLPFDFIRRENVWFGETSGERGWTPISEQLSLTDLGEWPPSRILGTNASFENCQQCHGSQIQVNYDAGKRSYVTRYHSLSINCESCHGPGREHVKLARSGKLADSPDIGMTALATLTKDQSLKVCFQCHSLKDGLETGYLPGKDLEEHYSLKFPIFGQSPYYPDGRIRAFGYQQTHRYSDCYLSGSMTCVDCHDPHSQNYRDVNGKTLNGRFDNGQCTGCHASKGLNPQRHSHHRSDSEGNQCTSCHMPFLQHSAVGKQLRFARSDHTIPIPRPVFDSELGIESACQKCHMDRTPAWLQAKTEEWYGQIKPHKKIVANQVDLSGLLDRIVGARLLLEHDPLHGIAQFSGLSIFIQKFLNPDMIELEPEIVESLKKMSMHEDVDLKSLALASLHLARDRDPDVHNFLVEQLRSLETEEGLVRKRWALALAFLGRTYLDAGHFDKSIRAYKKSLEIVPDDPATLTNLGVTSARKGELHKAIAYFDQALSLRPTEVMAWVSKGIAYEKLGDPDGERSAYLGAIAANPWNALAHFNLGNVYYKAKQYDRAIVQYQRAVEIEPNLALGHFYLGRTYVKISEPERAAAALRAGLQFNPKDQQARQMLNDLEAYLRGR